MNEEEIDSIIFYVEGAESLNARLIQLPTTIPIGLKMRCRSKSQNPCDACNMSRFRTLTCIQSSVRVMQLHSISRRW